MARCHFSHHRKQQEQQQQQNTSTRRTIVLQMNNCHAIDCILHVAYSTTKIQTDCAYRFLGTGYWYTHSLVYIIIGTHTILSLSLSLCWLLLLFISFVHFEWIDFTICYFLIQNDVFVFRLTKPNRTNPNRINNRKWMYAFVSYLFRCYANCFLKWNKWELLHKNRCLLLIDSTGEPFSFLFQLSYWLSWQN